MLTAAIEGASAYQALEEEVEAAVALRERWERRAGAVARLDSVIVEVRVCTAKHAYHDPAGSELQGWPSFNPTLGFAQVSAAGDAAPRHTLVQHCQGIARRMGLSMLSLLALRCERLLIPRPGKRAQQTRVRSSATARPGWTPR